MSWILSAHWWYRALFLLMSDCDSPYIGPSRWVVNHCYNHRASFSQPCSFCFCPRWWSLQGHGMQPVTTKFPNIGSNHCSRLFFIALSYSSHVDVLRKTRWTVPSITLLLYWRGAQRLKFSMAPVSVGFWYHPQLNFLLLSILIYKSKIPNFRLCLVSLLWTVNLDVVSLQPVALFQDHPSLFSLYCQRNGEII